MPNKVDYRTFSRRVKNKYPEYINMGDLELAQMWVEQNPQYGEFVIFDQQPVKKKDQAAPSLGAQGGLQYASTGDPVADKAQAQSALKGYSQKKDKSEEMGFWENIGNNILNGSTRAINDIFLQPAYEFGMVMQGVPVAGAQVLGKTARPLKEDFKTKTREEMGLLEESAAAFANSIPLMVGSIALGGVAGAGARVAGTLPMFMSGFQESGREADELGITDPLDRLTFQTIGGTIEGASELIMPDASLIRPLRQRALKDLVRVGGKGLSKADAGRYVAEFTEKVAKEIGEEYAVEIGNVLRNASFAAAGYDKAAPEMKSARDYAVMTLSAALGAGVFAGVGTGVDAAFAKSTAIKKAAENPEAAAQAAADLVDAGKLTQEQADAFLAKVASVNKAVAKMPKDVDPDVAVNTADLLNEKVDLEESVKALEEEKKNVDSSFHQGIDDQITQITARINELTQQITGFQTPTEQITPEAPQMAPAEVSPEVGVQIPQEDQSVLQVINGVMQPISSDIEDRMNNAEEIPMSEIESVVDALIDAQQSVRSQEGARTRQTQGGFVTEFGALSEDQKRNFDALVEQQINKLLNYEFATITTTEQTGEKTKTAGLVATPREGRPLPESVVSRERFDGAGVRIEGKGGGRVVLKRIPGFGGRSVYGISFGNRKGVSPIEDLEFDNLEFVAPEILADGSFNAKVRDAKSGLEFTITNPELALDLAIAAQLKEAGRKDFPQPAFLEAVREVTQGQPTQVTTFPNLGRTGTTPAAVGVEPQTEQDVRQETNAPQEGRGQGEDAAPVPQEEGRQEGQVTPPDVAQEGETPPATKRTRKTEQQKADEGKAILDKLKETLRALKAKPGGGANIDLTFGVVPISKAVWNTAIDTAILAIDAGQSLAQAVKAASDYISSKIDGDWGKAKVEQYMSAKFAESGLTKGEVPISQEGGISVKDVKAVKGEDFQFYGEWEVRLGNSVIGKLWYDKSLKSWMDTDAMFGPGSATNPFKAILGESKEEAIEKIVDNYNKSEKVKAKETTTKETEEREFSKDKILNGFLNRLSSLGSLEIPFFGDGFVYNGKALVEFDRFDKGDRNEVGLKSIMTIDDAGKGVGSEVMSDITSAADALGTKLTLFASPFGTKAMSPSKLVSFYKKFGFTIDLNEAYGGDFSSEESLLEYLDENPGEGVEMIREPKAKPESKPQQQAQAETKPTRKAKTVFHAGTLEGKGNIYVSPIREQANEYSSMSGAPVLEFEINENAMAPESEVRDLIRSLGLKLPEGYNLDELFLYEALDTRVKSSLSQGDIDKLYSALKDKGYEGIAFRDEDIRGVKREGIDNFIVFDKSSLSEQQAQPEAQVDATAKALEDALAPDDAFEMYRLSHVSDKGFVLQKSWIEEKLIELLPKIGARRFASLVREYVDEYFSASILKTPGMSFGELIGYLIGDGNLVYQGTETKWAELLKSQGVDVPSPKPGNVTYNPIRISEAYHKAKADGFNPKLVQAVDELLGQTPEAKPAKTIAEQRKEFRETAKKYFEGMKKMGVIFDAERNATEDIAFIKALTKYIKLEIDNGMVTFKGFVEKTAGMIEDFNDASVKRIARDVWSKEVVKAYPKIYAKLQKAQKALLDKELVEARKELRINLKNLLSDKKIFKQISSLTTERKLDKSSSDILVGIRSEIEALGGIGKLSDEQLISYSELATETYKEGRINQKQFIDALAKEKAETSKNAKSAITNQGERSAFKLKDAEEAREFLAENNGDNSNQVNINNGEVIVESVDDFDAILPLIGKGATFGGTTTSPNPNNVKRGKKNFFRTTLGGGLIYLLDKFKGKKASQETIDFFNNLQEEVKAGTRQKKRLKATLNNQRKVAIERIFRGQARYIAFMLSRPKVNGKRLVIKDNNGKEIKRINVAGVLYYYQLMKDPHFLKKDGNGERKIGLSESSMKDIVDFINLPENAKVRELINIDQLLIKKAAQNAAQVMEANNISSELFTPRTLDLSKYENDTFIGEILNKIYNNAVPSEIEYFPSNVESDANSQVPEVDALLDQEMDTNAVSAMSRFMIERVSGGKVRIKSYDAQLGEYFDSMSNTASKLPILKRFQAVFNKENSNLISSYYGKNTTDELRENIGRYITSRQQDSGLAKYISSGPFSKWLASGLGVQMVFAFTSAFSQLSSTPGPILSYGVKNYLDGLLMLTSGEVNARRAIVDLTDGSLFRERFGSRIEVADIVKAIPSDETGFASYVNEINKKLISIGAIPSSAFDALSIILSLPIYAREYSNALKTMTRKEAADYAENVLMDKAENFLQSKSDEMMSSFESKHRTTLYAFATVVPQLQRQAIMAFKRIQRGEGDLAQNINVLVWSGIGSSVAFRLLRPYFESLFEGDDDDEELKKLRDDKRLKRTTIDLAVDATKSLGTWGAISAGVLKTAYQLAEAEGDASVARRALDITPEVLEFVPAVSIKVSSINNAIKSYYDDEDLRGTTQAIQALTNIPAEKARGLAVQMSDAFLIDQFTLGERLTRLAGFVSENKAKEKIYQKSISTNPEMRELLSPSEIQRFESKQKSEYKSATSVIAKQYSEATTQQDRDVAMSKLFSLQASTTKYSAKESGELIQQIQDDFDNKVVENSLPEGFLEIKRMPSTKKVNFVANEFNKIKDTDEALSYVESLYMYGVISENERGEVFDILLQTKTKQ